MHIYMSVGKMAGHASLFDLKKTVLVNPKTNKPNDTMNYRGELKLDDTGKFPPGSDPDSFKELMARKGHVVVVSEEFLGTSYLLREPTSVKDAPVTDGK